MPLGLRLLEAGAISREQLDDALARQCASGLPIGQILVDAGYTTPMVVQKEIAQQLGLPFCDLDEIEISKEALGKVPLELIQHAKAIPVAVNDGTITLAMANPLDFATIESVQFATGLQVKRVVAAEDEIIDAVEKNYGITVEDLLADMRGQGMDTDSDESYVIHDLQAMAREPTLVNLVNLILSQAIHDRSSDIHIEPFEKELKIKYRVDGVLHEIQPPPKNLQPAIISRLKIMASMDIAERFVPQDGHIRLNLPDRSVDIRVATLPTIFGESMVLRILDRLNAMVELEELGMPPKTLERYGELLKAAYGIILVTGPTGSGKTTTLYASLTRIFTPGRKFITIEDPVEYQLPGIVQIPVRPKRGMDFANGLRAIVRQDPDVVMVGEIRDGETADIAIRAALTGHLVFSTLHTNDAAGAVTRLIDMGVEAFLVASSVEGIMAQRLVRRLCHHCRQSIPVNPAYLPEFGVTAEQLNTDHFYQPGGCEHCRSRGYTGRIGVYELLLITEEIHEMILRRASSAEIKNRALRWMETMKQDGFHKVCRGVTTVEEVLQVTQKQFVE
ncbi:MAG: ATPase, T2SS/T4P/T4SS family [Candidatus Sumerlaeota bacterium]|nr:ATPase, T2SS/T4P/T4SS family [Candidatus Sumerlaeota bacterium]